MKSTLLFAGALALAALPLAVSAASNGAQQYDFTLPVVELNNPCTGVVDSIDGEIDLHVVKQQSPGVTFLQVNGHGTAVDAWGRRYQINAKKKLQFHDPLPATAYLNLRLVSQGDTANAQLLVALHVNEQGVVTKAEFSGVECLG